MKMSSREYDSLVKLVRTKSKSEVNANMRTKIIACDPNGADQDLKSLGKEMLRTLIDMLPSGHTAHVHSPLLHSIRTKAKTSLAGLKVPHLDPESYPQVYRMQMKINNKNAGIKNVSMGQWGRKHPKGMSITLGGKITWNDYNSGELVIMGTWADITKAITDAGTGLSLVVGFDDIYKDDVNAQMDAMYGSLGGDGEDWWEQNKDDLNLIVSCESSVKWSKTDRDGEVVLNAPREIIELVVGRAAGVGGQIPTSTALSVTGDSVGLVAGMVGPEPIKAGASKLVQMTGLTRAPDKALYTITVGLGPTSKKYAIARGKELGSEELLELAIEARDTETG